MAVKARVEIKDREAVEIKARAEVKARVEIKDRAEGVEIKARAEVKAREVVKARVEVVEIKARKAHRHPRRRTRRHRSVRGAYHSDRCRRAPSSWCRAHQDPALIPAPA